MAGPCWAWTSVRPREVQAKYLLAEAQYREADLRALCAEVRAKPRSVVVSRGSSSLSDACRVSGSGHFGVLFSNGKVS